MRKESERNRLTVGKRLLACMAALAVGWMLLLPTEAWAQKVTVRIEQGTLDQAFQTLMKQSKIQLVYNSAVAKKNRCTSHNFQQTEVSVILNTLLRNTPLTYRVKNNSTPSWNVRRHRRAERDREAPPPAS